QRTTFFAIVDDDACAALLSAAYALFDAVREVWAARANVGAEHVRTVAFVMDSHSELPRRIRDARHVSEQVNRRAADGRQEHLEITAGDQLGEHPGGVLEQGASQVGLPAAEACSDAGEVPHGFDGDLDH